MKRIMSALFVCTYFIALHNAAWAFSVTSPFGWRIHPVSGEWQYHTGIDIAEDSGCAIPAFVGGQVAFADAYGGYGHTVLIRHENDTYTLYSHCDRIYVRPGQRVAAGEIIASVGSTGVSTGPHLHLELWMDGQYTDPAVLFGPEQAPEYMPAGEIRFDQERGEHDVYKGAWGM